MKSILSVPTYETELTELNTWRFHCCRKAEKLCGLKLGKTPSKREVAEYEISLEYEKRFKYLKTKYGIEKQVVSMPSLEHILDKQVI